MTVLVDTSAFVILVDPDNDQHGRATDVLEQVRDDRIGLVTHEYIVVETIALLQRRIGLTAVGHFVGELLPLVETIWVDPELHRSARDALLATGRRRFSFVDWTSFLAMRRLGITTAFAFDADFATQGFEVMPTLP